jgi:hypothetical protein
MERISVNKIALAVSVCLCLIAAGCKTKKANIVLDGALTTTTSSDGYLEFDGYVINDGDGTGYNCEVRITCYLDAAKTVTLDTPIGYPAHLANIAPGERVAFAAVCSTLKTDKDIAAIDYNIYWVNR